jgi:hypothetical protein
MFNTLRTAIAAGFLGFAALAAPVEAQEVDFHLGNGDGRIGIHLGDGFSRHHFRDDFGWHGRGCTPERALYKARRLGLNRARIDYVSRGRIGIVGRSNGERVHLTFARAPRCPVIG